jgi:hypothetical protein
LKSKQSQSLIFFPPHYLLPALRLFRTNVLTIGRNQSYTPSRGESHRCQKILIHIFCSKNIWIQDFQKLGPVE